mmetsp:Transcript_39503/g.77869  ORF Transcript_39503/g.77869 Transcript_39503/m.77869 type:complete len:232 (+) Transcript_39503:86-781(+)
MSSRRSSGSAGIVIAADATTKIVVVCNQRPLCLCPTIGGGSGNKAKQVVRVRPNDTVKAFKIAVQAQLNRGNQMNFQMLDPLRQVLFHPEEGHELQDQMPHGFKNGQHVKLKLAALIPPSLVAHPPWNKAFDLARSLTVPKGPVSDRPIRDVAMEISVFRTGGTSELASSFAERQSTMLGVHTEAEIQGLGVPETEWRHVNSIAERSVYSKAGAANSASMLVRSSRSRSDI